MKRVVQIVLALAIVGFAIWGWRSLHPSPETVIRSRLNDLAKTMSFKSGAGVLSKAYNAEKASEFFTPDIEVVINLAGFEPIAMHGRDEIVQYVMYARSHVSALKIEFPDVNVTVAPDGQTAKVNLTGKATVPGERDISAQEFNFKLKKVDGKWQIFQVETVKTLSSAAADPSSVAVLRRVDVRRGTV